MDWLEHEFTLVKKKYLLGILLRIHCDIELAHSNSEIGEREITGNRKVGHVQDRKGVIPDFASSKIDEKRDESLSIHSDSCCSRCGPAKRFCVRDIGWRVVVVLHFAHPQKLAVHKRKGEADPARNSVLGRVTLHFVLVDKGRRGDELGRILKGRVTKSAQDPRRVFEVGSDDSHESATIDRTGPWNELFNNWLADKFPVLHLTDLEVVSRGGRKTHVRISSRQLEFLSNIHPNSDRWRGSTVHHNLDSRQLRVFIIHNVTDLDSVHCAIRHHSRFSGYRIMPKRLILQKRSKLIFFLDN